MKLHFIMAFNFYETTGFKPELDYGFIKSDFFVFQGLKLCNGLVYLQQLNKRQ